MVQSLSPDFRNTSSQTGTSSGTTLLDRVRRLVLPDQGDRPVSRRTVDPTRSREATSPRAAALTRRMAIVLPRLLFGVCIVLFALAVGLFAFRALYSDKIYPAVVVGDVQVGGLTEADARDRLSTRAGILETGGLTFSYGGQTWTPTLDELGGDIQVEEALSEAQQFGRTGDAMDRLAFTGDILQQDQSIPLRSTLNPSVLNRWFDQVDQDINQFAVDAVLVVSGTEVSITPDATGVVVDRDAMTAMILQTLEDLQPLNSELPMSVDQPNVVVADLEAPRDRLAGSLGEHIRVDFEGTSWRIEPDVMSQYLIVSQTYANGESKVDIAMDEDALSDYLRETFAADVNRTPVNATVGWQSGSGLFAKTPSTEGATMKPGEFATMVSDSFLGDHERVSVPVVVTKPRIDQNNLAALKIDSLVGRGDSNFEGSTDSRAVNIGVGVNLLNGELVGPGELFSFNGAIGEITADKGYVESSVVVAERVGKDVGGGICQVSTTVFRAALDAGMTLEQWNPHTYRIQGYEYDDWNPGFDASILQLGTDPTMWGDLTFTNNTDGYILVQSWTDYPHVVVEIYGYDDGRTVDIYDQYVSEPIPAPETAGEYVDNLMAPGTWDIAEYPLNGLEASFMYTVTAADGSLITERYFGTYFKERGLMYKVAPGMEGQSPAG